MADVTTEVTEPLANGAELPDHPANTTALKVIKYGKVFDADDGRPLRAGLHQSTLRTLMSGQRILGHLYAYVILDHHIYHTRNRVVVDVECVER